MAMNLVQARSEASVWDRSAREWDAERWLSALAAASLLLASVRGRSAAGWLLLAGSGALGYWAASSAESRSLRRERVRGILPFRRRQNDVVSEASEESFPASDAPALTPATTHAR